MIIKAEPFTLNELKEYNQELGDAVQNYFKMHPKKTVFIIDKEFTIRKHIGKVNVYEAHRR